MRHLACITIPPPFALSMSKGFAPLSNEMGFDTLSPNGARVEA